MFAVNSSTTWDNLNLIQSHLWSLYSQIIPHNFILSWCIGSDWCTGDDGWGCALAWLLKLPICISGLVLPKKRPQKASKNLILAFGNHATYFMMSDAHIKYFMCSSLKTHNVFYVSSGHQKVGCVISKSQNLIF